MENDENTDVELLQTEQTQRRSDLTGKYTLYV